MRAPFALTLWRTFSRGRRAHHTWRSFVDTFVKDPEVVRDKKSVAGFSLASFQENKRTLSRVEQVHALVFDFDNGDTTFKQAVKLFADTAKIVYTTFSHTTDHPKLRLILPFPRPVSADEYARVWDWAAKKITSAGHMLDEAARDASRFWYLPSHKPKAPYEWRELSGSLIDLEGALRAVPHTPPSISLLGADTASRRPPRKWAEVDGEAAKTFFGRAFEHAGLAFYDPLENGALPVVCPWFKEHTTGDEGDSSTVIFPPTTSAQWGLFHCSHAHCAQRTTLDLLDVLPSTALDAARKDHGSGLVRVKIRAGWTQKLDSLPGVPALERMIMRCYPNGGGPPLVWTVKIGSRAHTAGLDGMSVEELQGRRVDLVLRGREISWGRLAP